MHRHCQQQALGIHHYVALAPLHLLACVVTPWPPFSAVFTDWLSMIAALGLVRRPPDWRVRDRKVSWALCQVPSRRQVRK